MVRVSYHHPLEEGLGRVVTISTSGLVGVSYHHPLEEGLGRLCVLECPDFRIVSYHHPLEEGLGLSMIFMFKLFFYPSVTIIH